MANEITYSSRITVSKGNLQITYSPSAIQPDLESDTGSAGQQIIGTTPEAVTIGTDTSSGGMAFFRNLSTAASITVSKATNTASFDALLRLLPGEYVICRLQTTNVWAQAFTVSGATQATLQYHILSS
jgi:hypothetical protein